MKNKGIKKRICCFMVMLMLFALSSIACNKKEPSSSSIACNKKEPSSIAEDSNPVQSSFSDVYKLYMEEANQKIKEITIEKTILEEIGKHGRMKEINEYETRLAFDLNDLDHDGTPELMMFKKYFFWSNQKLSGDEIATALVELRILTCENGISKEIFSDTFYDPDDLMGKSPAACLQYCIDKETGDKFILRGGIKVSTHGDNSFYYSVLELQENKVIEKEIFRLYEEHAYANMDDPKAKHYYKHQGKEVTKEDYEKSLANYEESFARIDIFNYEINRAVPLLNLLENQDYWQDAVPLDEERIAKILNEKGNFIVVHENPFDASKINVSDKVCGLTLVNKGVSHYNGRDIVYQLDFSGEIVVSGTYENCGIPGPYTPSVSFYPDDDSLALFPKAISDTRTVWFNLNNYREIKSKFGEVGSSGKATIVIKNYLIDLEEAATSNRADLITVAKLEAKTVEETIVEDFKMYKKENIIKVFYEDFDADGVKEAFILTGNLTKDGDEYSWTNGKVWFASQVYTGMMIQEGFYTHSPFDPEIMTIEDMKLLHVKKAADSAGYDSFLYGVKGGEPYVCFDYLAGEIHEEGGELFLKHCTREAYYEKERARDAGYTYKNYYLYPEIENGQFKGIREYGAIEISLAQFSGLTGAQDILGQIKASSERVEIRDILFRGNGIFNINFVVENDLMYENKHATVNYDGKGVHNFAVGDGHYCKAIIPEIATYHHVEMGKL